MNAADAKHIDSKAIDNDGDDSDESNRRRQQQQQQSDVQLIQQGKRKRMVGKKMRDEFLCPITYELMRDPVVACDGHSYERQAIEKWLKTHKISPRSGELMQSLLIPNINLRKLIMDIIDEGGAGFYTDDISNKDRMFEVRPMKVLVLECLGPPESEWNQQSFQVSNIGCIGGRKLPTEDEFLSKEPILFKDITVSRRHFEINQRSNAQGGQQFFIRDLGSAGGTFIRISHGVRKQLHPGMIILLGKHQFTVSSIDDGVPATSEISSVQRRRSSIGNGLAGNNSNNNNSSSGVQPDVILSLVENAEKIIANLDNGNAAQGPAANKQAELSSRLKSLTMELSHHLDASDDFEAADAKSSAAAAAASATATTSATAAAATGANVNGAGAGSKSGRKHPGLQHGATMRPGEMESLGSDMDVDDEGGNSSSSDAKDTAERYASRRLVLTCCAPDGSPLQGQTFEVTSEGACLGRKITNTIPLLIRVTDAETGEDRVVNVDTAISSEHARVDFDFSTGNFFINDGGSLGKASTNGTWYRLSGPQQESPPHLLGAGTEVLIGTVRFLVKESMTIAEQSVSSDSKTPHHGSNSSRNSISSSCK